MTTDELNIIFDRCRKRANRVGFIFGTFGISCGVVVIATDAAISRGWFSREILYIVACLILLLTFLVLILGLRYLRKIPIMFGALCPKCGSSLIAQRVKVLETGVCGECNNTIIEVHNKEDAPGQKAAR